MRRRHFRHAQAVELLVVGVVIAGVLGSLLIHDHRSSASPETTHRETLVRQTGKQSTSDDRAVLTAADADGTLATSPSVPSTPTPGEIISLPSAGPGELTLIATDAIPLITQQQAMQAVFDMGVPWGLGDPYEGRTPDVSATYGLVTFGSRAANGEWVGLRNIELPTGEVLDHIEARPMWIIDYGNTVAYGSQAVFNNTVYAVDALTGTVVKAWFYNHTPIESNE